MAVKLVNASSQYLDTPYSADFDFGSGDFTVCWWDYLVTAVHNCGILCNVTNAAVDRSLHIGYIDTGTNKRNNFFSYTGTAWNIQIQHGSQPIGSWNHWAITRTGTTWRGYKDGAQDYTIFGSTSGSIHVNSNNLDVGRYRSPVPDTYFDGYMTDFRVYKGTALNDAQIKTIYSCKGCDNITDNLKCRWLLIENYMGQTVTSGLDLSVNNHTLTPYNLPTYISAPITILTRRRR